MSTKARCAYAENRRWTVCINGLPTAVAILLLIHVASPVVTAQSSEGPPRWSPEQFGDVSDAGVLSTTAFQKAIDAAHDAGGGVVQVRAGTYLIGTLELRTGVTLYLEKGATLLGSPRVADYRRGHWPALIKAKGQQRVAIVGEGVIDGQGTRVAEDTVRIFESGNYLEFFPGLGKEAEIFTGDAGNNEVSINPWALQRAGALGRRVSTRDRADKATWRVDGFVRPQILEFWRCQDVRVEGISLKHAANWVQTYRECEDVVVKNIKVDSTTYWNNDGLDIVNSRRVKIEGCDINAADDGICFKSEPSTDGRWCEDIDVSNCRIRTSASGVKFGTASFHGFRRVQVRDIEVYDTFRSAIAIESVDGGGIEDITVERIRARNTGNAIFVRLGQRNVAKPPGYIRRVRLADIQVHVPSGKPDTGYKHEGPPIKQQVNVIPASIVGLPDAEIDEITVRDLSIIYGGGGRRDRAEVALGQLARIPQARENYPEFSMFGELPAWGMFIRNARNVRLENVSLALETADYRAAMVATEASNLIVEGVRFLSAGEEPVLLLHKVEGAMFKRMSWPEAARERLRQIDSKQVVFEP